MKVQSQERAEYLTVANPEDNLSDERIVARAIEIVKSRIQKTGDLMSNPESVKNYFVLKNALLEHEVFGCMFLNSQNNLISYQELFRGTLTQTSVYPREVVKAALGCNAASVIFTHNHPSGICQQSNADVKITSELKKALAMVDVVVLDHIIVAGVDTLSFAEKGLI